MILLTNSIRKSIKSRFPRLHYLYKYYINEKIWKYKIVHENLINDINTRHKKINVVFFASVLGMWRYQGIYDLLKSDARFICHIVILPFSSYSEESQRNAFDNLKTYFQDKNILYIDAWHEYEKAYEWIKNLNPEILFYPQPYNNSYYNKLDPVYFKNRLLCYCPYGVSTMANKGLYNSTYQNVAWKLFYPTVFNYEDAKKLALNHGENVVLTGDPNADIIGKIVVTNPWKPQNSKKKKIIWAPHFTIKPSFCLNRTSFQWLNEFMLEIAKEYKDQIQIAFKPHPGLKTALYTLDGWGKERTDNYYKAWAEGENTQLEEGDYKDLFTTSDAMIHDCGSFTVEYIYTCKPVLFVAADFEQAFFGLNELGKSCMNLHYKASSRDEIIAFIDDVILGKDEFKSRRSEFYNLYLKSPNGNTAAENMYNSIITGLHLK